MASNKKKTILLIVLMIVIAGAAVGYLQWNKPHPKAEDEAGIPVKSEALFAAFSTDETKANAAYLNKVLEVDGAIGELTKNQDGKTVAVLAAGDPLGGVQCTFRDSSVVLQQGQQVKVKGFCNGYTMVVLLNDCVISKGENK